MNSSKPDDLIDKRHYPQLDAISWHMGGVGTLTRAEALGLYEANWVYVEVRALGTKEQALIADLARHEGNGLFFPKGGQPIDLEGVLCV